MAAELEADYLTGKTVYFQLRSATGTIWNGSGFEAYLTANIATYKIAATEQGTASGYYTATMPGVAAGVYNAVAKVQAGGAPAESDLTVANGTIEWSGSAMGFPSNVKKNQALNNFEFLMTDSTNHSPATGKTVTVTRSIDGGAFGAGTLSAVTEVANGMYSVNFGAGDLNGNVITLRATATGADDTFERIVTQP